MRKWFLVKEKSQCYNEGNGKRKNSFQQSANNDREATLGQFFQRNILLQNKISYQEALDEVVEILVDGISKHPDTFISQGEEADARAISSFVI